MVSCAQTKKLLKSKHSEQGSKETPRMGAEREGAGTNLLATLTLHSYFNFE